MKKLLALACCTLLPAIAQAQVSRAEGFFSIPFATPSNSCWNRASLRQPPGIFDLKTVSLDYTIVTEAADINSDRDAFVVLSSSTQGLWLLNSSGIWRQYSPGQYVETAAAPLAKSDPFLRLEIFKNNDLSVLPADAQLYVGYGILAKGGTTSTAFQEMLDSKRFELIWSKNSGLKPGPNLFCVSVTNIAVTSLVAYPTGTQ